MLKSYRSTYQPCIYSKIKSTSFVVIKIYIYINYVLKDSYKASYYNRAVKYLTKNEFDKECEKFHCAQRLSIDQASFAIEKYCKFKE